MDARKVKGKLVHCKLSSWGIDSVVKELGGIGTIIESQMFLDAAQIFMAPSTMVNSTTGKLINNYITSTRHVFMLYHHFSTPEISNKFFDNLVKGHR